MALGKAPSLTVFLRNVDALPLSSHRANFTEMLSWGFLLMFLNWRIPWITASVRSLRTLPISSRQFSWLPVGLGLISATALWIVLSVLHLVVTGTIPVAPRIDLFSAFAAVTAIGHTIRFITPGQLKTKGMAGMAPAMIGILAVIFVDTWHPEIVQPAMLVGGILLLAASVAVMRYSVTRTSRMYRQPAVAGRFQ